MQDISHETGSAGDTNRQRIFVYNGGFLTNRRVRRILDAAGYDIRLGWPSEGDSIAIWGNSPTAYRGQCVAKRSGTQLIYMEDCFLRSLFPGRKGEPPLGLLIDHKAPHFDPARPSDLEHLLQTDPLDDSDLLRRARAAIERIQDAHLTKYTGFELDQTPPEPGYVLVVDQLRDDASVTASKANDALFQEMLVMAQEEHPGARVLIKTHPETQQGFRPGYFGEKDVNERVTLWDQPISPWQLFEGAVGVYTVSSQMGFEAIFTGHRPRVFGQPFYIGWGLTSDERPLPRRNRNLTKTQLFAATMIRYPVWYDPASGNTCDIEVVIDHLEAQTRAWREDHKGWRGQNIRLWKRAHFQTFFGQHRAMRFARNAPERRQMVWGSKPCDSPVVRVEDGFLRSRGLGAQLVPPVSLVLDDLGIYYDPTQPSRLEQLIQMRSQLSEAQHERARRLIETLRRQGLSKYNLQGAVPDLPSGYRILVPGQVEDDASILKGADHITTNAALLQAVRQENPDAILIYKPHPDVIAGLRSGALSESDLADVVVHDADIAAILEQVDAVATMTSLAGFEALLRGCKVTSYGAPFYAGWGLTRDQGNVPVRRQARPSLEALVHATLIDYPRYIDPVTKQPCSVERAIARLAENNIPKARLTTRLLAKLQGVFASYHYLWR